MAKQHVLHNPDYPLETSPIIGTCKDCKPYSHMDMKGCDGFRPRTFADADKLAKALGLDKEAETVGAMEAVANDEYRDLVDADAQELEAAGKALVDAPRLIPELIVGAPTLADTVRNLAVGNQQTPHGSGREITPLVIADLETRSEFGKEKYGEPLTAFNGRDTLQDLYQEALDLVVYFRQLIEERDSDHPMAGPIDDSTE
jgi:hypothetical protein